MYCLAITFRNINYEPDVVLHTCNPNIWEAEERGFQVQGQPGLYRKTLSQTHTHTHTHTHRAKIMGSNSI
jgi:hypothetical protein